MLPVHYYTPIPDTRVLKKSFQFDEILNLDGINMNDEKQLELMNQVSKKYRNEYENFPLEPTDSPIDYYLNNGSFGFVSGQMNYSLVRYFKPKAVVEIGSGNSTLNTLTALNKNIDEGDKIINFTAIEPYPQEFLRKIKYDYFHLIIERLENINMELFEALEEGDMLFIDSTHVSKFGSDVNYYMFTILPKLKPGVIIHIHDIQFPFDYFKSYILKNHYFWNEQYLVQAFLMYNNSFEIIWCASYMTYKYPELLKKNFPHFNSKRIPTSLYLRKIK